MTKTKQIPQNTYISKCENNIKNNTIKNKN